MKTDDTAKQRGILKKQHMFSKSPTSSTDCNCKVTVSNQYGIDTNQYERENKATKSVENNYRGFKKNLNFRFMIEIFYDVPKFAIQF